MNIIRRLASDAWENVLTGLGTRSRDKRQSALVKRAPVNVTAELYEYLYTGDDVAARIAELPPREMTREWIDLVVDTDGLEPNGRTESLEDATDIARDVMNKLEELKAKRAFFEAMVWARVYGNGAVFFGVDDGREVEEPLDENAIRSFDFLTVFDRWELHVDSFYDDPGDENFGKPEIYRIVQDKGPGQVAATVQGTRIHETRLVMFDGVLTSRRRKREQNGWSDSIYARLESIIRDYSTSFEGVAAHLQDWGQFVYKMRGLADMLASDDDKVILDRIQTVDVTRSVLRAILLDADGEDVTRIATPASGIPELLDRVAQRLAQAAEMPVTLLQGRSPAGENATGESDIQFFYDQIRAKQESDLRDPIERMIRLVFLSADGPTNGSEPESWSFEFKPLWQMTDLQKAELRKTQAETDSIYIGDDVVTPDEIAQSRFGGDRYSVDTTLDVEAREEAELEEEEMRRQLRDNPPPVPPVSPVSPVPPQPGQPPVPPQPPAVEPNDE